MGFEDSSSYSKKLRISRELAHEFVSVRQYLNIPANDQFDLSTTTNDQLQTIVINRAIKWSFETGLLKTLTDLCDNSRLNGASIHVHIKTENWESMVLLLDRVKRWGKLDEWDLIEHCLKTYIEEVKRRRCLP
jgi:hypothetical protein